MATWAQFESEASQFAGIAIEVTGEAKNAYVTGSEPPGGFHAFRLELHDVARAGGALVPAGPDQRNGKHRARKPHWVALATASSWE